MPLNPEPPSVNRPLCACGSGKTYAECCEPLHNGAPAPNAEALMRSRYSAYVKGLDAYLLASWHPSRRPQHLESFDPVTWLGLSIRRSELHDDDHATVEFVARHRVGGGSAQRLHEVSHFVRENGHWYYLDGEQAAQTRRR